MSLKEKVQPFLRACGQDWSARAGYWAPVLLGLGIGAYFSSLQEPGIAETSIVLSLAGISLIFTPHRRSAQAVFLTMLGFFSAACATQVYGTPMLDWPTKATTVQARILDVEQHRSGRRILLDQVRIDQLPEYRTPARIRVVVPRRLDGQAGDLRPGQRLQAVAKVLPFSEPMTPGGFDFRRNAFFQGIGATGYLMGKIVVTEPPPQEAQRAQVWFANLRQKLQAAVKRHLQGDRAGLAIVLLTGDKSSLSARTAQAMRSVGLAHLLAIAGLHVGLVAGIVFFFVRACLALFPFMALRYPIKKWAALAALVAICFFTMQVGAPVPTRRAVVMTGVVLLGILFDRLTVSLRTVALAGFFILLLWPQMLLHPAFQLSFAAVLGLIAVGEAAEKSGWRLFPGRSGALWGLARHVIQLAGMSVVATVGTLPFCLYHFQEVETYGVLANTLAIPLTSFVLMPLCVLTEAMWLFGAEALPLRVLDPGLGLLIDISQKIAAFPGAHSTPPPMPESLLVMAALGGLFFCFMQGKARWVGLAALLVAVGLTFAQERPVAWIGPNGRQAGWIDFSARQVVVTALDKKPDKYLAEYWSERAGFGKSGVRYVSDEDDGAPLLSCDNEACVFSPEGVAIVWAESLEAMPEVCQWQGALIVNGINDDGCNEVARAGLREGARPSMPSFMPASMPVTLTRLSFRQHGAYALFAGSFGVRLQYARQGWALRPWSVGWRPQELASGDPWLRTLLGRL